MGIIGIIILLFLALIILILLNHTEVVISNTSNNTSESNTINSQEQPLCADTHFGCCPDGVNSKDNLFGTNCPGYNQ